jgi:hypothetical protein
MGQEHLLGEFESGYGLLAGNAGEVFQELVERIARFKVVEEGANRDTGSKEDRRPAEDIRVTVDHW